MERRRFLAAVGSLGAAGLSGCASALIADDVTSGDGEDAGDGGPGGGLGGGSGDLDVRIEDSELVVDDEDTLWDAYVEATVTNRGDARTGDVDLVVDWYDENDDYLGNDETQVVTLEPGETWVPRVNAADADDNRVDGYELTVEPSTDAPQSPADVEIVESDLRIEDDDVTVVGRVENNTGGRLDYVEAYAKLYDAEGRVLADEWTNESDVPEDTVWRCDLSFFSFERVDRIEDFTIGLDADVF